MIKRVKKGRASIVKIITNGKSNGSFTFKSNDDDILFLETKKASSYKMSKVVNINRQSSIYSSPLSTRLTTIYPLYVRQKFLRVVSNGNMSNFVCIKVNFKMIINFPPAYFFPKEGKKGKNISFHFHPSYNIVGMFETLSH